MEFDAHGRPPAWAAPERVRVDRATRVGVHGLLRELRAKRETADTNLLIRNKRGFNVGLSANKDNHTRVCNCSADSSTRPLRNL